MTQMDKSPVTAKEVREWSRRDTILSRVIDFVLKGWPDEFEASCELKQYFQRKDELTVEGCLLWGSRVVVPIRLQTEVLKELHDGHLGMSRMKMLAKGFVWWSGKENRR